MSEISFMHSTDIPKWTGQETHCIKKLHTFIQNTQDLKLFSLVFYPPTHDRSGQKKLEKIVDEITCDSDAVLTKSNFIATQHSALFGEKLILVTHYSNDKHIHFWFSTLALCIMAVRAHSTVFYLINLKIRMLWPCSTVGSHPAIVKWITLFLLFVCCVFTCY